MTADDTELVYEALARAIDAAGPERAQLMLAKLALLMAQDIGDAPRVLALIDLAGQHLNS